MIASNQVRFDKTMSKKHPNSPKTYIDLLCNLISATQKFVIEEYLWLYLVFLEVIKVFSIRAFVYKFSNTFQT